jgi:hypothetical protein
MEKQKLTQWQYDYLVGSIPNGTYSKAWLDEYYEVAE